MEGKSKIIILIFIILLSPQVSSQNSQYTNGIYARFLTLEIYDLSHVYTQNVTFVFQATYDIWNNNNDVGYAFGTLCLDPSFVDTYEYMANVDLALEIGFGERSVNPEDGSIMPYKTKQISRYFGIRFFNTNITTLPNLPDGNYTFYIGSCAQGIKFPEVGLTQSFNLTLQIKDNVQGTHIDPGYPGFGFSVDSHQVQINSTNPTIVSSQNEIPFSSTFVLYFPVMIIFNYLLERSHVQYRRRFGVKTKND